MSASKMPLSGRLLARSKTERRSRARVFLFIACQQEVLHGFEASVSRVGAIEDVEPVAVGSYPTTEYLEAFLTEHKADISCVTIDLSSPDEAMELISIAARLTPDALVLAADDGKGEESLLPALRAGANDVIAPPFDLDRLTKTALDRSSGGHRGAGQVACFLPAQGGSGASTTAIHFAASLATELGPDAQPDEGVSPVLLLDLDFHSDSAAFWLGRRPAYSLIDALEGSAASALYWKRLTTTWNGVDLLSPPPPDCYLTDKLLEKLAIVLSAAQKVYPWVVVDLPPTLFSSTRQLLPLADLVFLVCTPEARALYLAKRRISDLQAIGIADDALRVVLNRAGAKRAIEAETAEQSIGEAVTYSIENDYAEISSAYSDRRLASPDSAPGRRYRAMARVSMGLDTLAEVKVSGWRKLVGLG